jgi:hypothetical protein
MATKQNMFPPKSLIRFFILSATGVTGDLRMIEVRSTILHRSMC